MFAGPNKIVLLTGSGPEHRYVANKLCAEFSLDAIVVDKGRPIGWRARLYQLLRRHGYLGIVERGILRLWGLWGGPRKARRRALQKVLGESAEQFAWPSLVTEVAGVNGPQCIELLTALEPRILLIYGTPIVSRRVLGFATGIALNMHTGISPYYRGADCAFWPLYKGEVEFVGATVHECTSDIDGGKIFAVARANICAEDDIEMAFARCVAVGANLYCHVLRERLWENPSGGQLQDFSLGREYRSTMRGLWQELVLRRRIRKGLIRNYVKATDTSSLTKIPNDN
jgi:methionyl-tRNA formyltransferase